MSKQEHIFKTDVYRRVAGRTFGRMAHTTLRRTGLERAFEEVNSRNKSVLMDKMRDQVQYESIIRKCGNNPEAIWKEVKRAGGEKDENAVRVVGMCLGNPNAYEGFPPNPTIRECLEETIAEDDFRELCGYTASFGIPELVEFLKSATMSDPTSVHKPPEKFKDVEVIVTAGGSQAAQLGMDPALNTPADTVGIHDWIYIIHLGAAYYKNAHLENFDLRNDGVPDPDSLARVLEESDQNGRVIQCVVSTTIGNPIGSATPEDVLIRTMEVIDRHVRQGKRETPIIAFFDTAYEAFRPGGKPLDPIEIAIDNGIEIPVGVFETASKGHGLCGMRLGCLRMWWPKDHFAKIRVDYLKCLDSKTQPTLGLDAVLVQKMFLRYLKRMQMDAEQRKNDMEFLKNRREKANANLLEIANHIRDIDGVYLAKYYDHNGKRGGKIDPNTLASFYITFGFDGLNNREGSEFNQAQWFAEFCLDNGLPVINAVPGIAFLPRKRWSAHPGLIRITGLTGEADTNAFLESVAAAAEYLQRGRGKGILVTPIHKAEQC